MPLSKLSGNISKLTDMIPMGAGVAQQLPFGLDNAPTVANVDPTDGFAHNLPPIPGTGNGRGGR